MKVEIKSNDNLKKILEDPVAFAEQFPCLKCGTISKKIADKKFHCPKCNCDFKIKPEYINSSK